MQPVAKSRLIFVLRALAALSVMVSFGSLWLSERSRVLDDLQLSAEATARPGETVALRAFYLRDVEAPRGPELARTDVQVRLLDARAREVGRTLLRPGRGDPSMEGRIALPAAGHGSLTLEARAELPDRRPIVSRRAIDLRADAPLLAPRPREAAPLSLLALAALRPLEGGTGDGLRLEPRVVGGACVPEQLCRLIVWMGAPAALRVRHDDALRVESLAPASETAGFVVIGLRMFGPEASLTLEASRGGQRVAERSLRLPVALGEAQLDSPQSLFAAGAAPNFEVVLPPGRRQGIVDLFVAGRWSATRAVEQAGEGVARIALPSAWLAPGLLRVQAHSDRFAGEGAGARLIYLRAAGESVAQALRTIGREVRGAGFDALPLSAEGELPAQADPELSATFLMATLEGLRVPLPRSVSGRPPELARLSRAQAALRFGVGGMLTLSALVVGLTLMRRGFSAQAEARAILEEAAVAGGERAPEDEEDAARNNGPSRGVLVVVSLGLAVSLAFVLAALLIVAKPLWF